MATTRSEWMSRAHFESVPPTVLSDSYKSSHFLQYPSCRRMVAYGEFRRGYEKDLADTRMVHVGIRHILESVLLRRWTEDDVKKAELFYATHRAPDGSHFPWAKKLFTKVVREHGGYFPIRVQALREGTCTHVRVPTYQISAEGDFAPLCTFLETQLTHIWYPCTVATLSRRARDVVEKAFEQGADGGAQNPLVASRLHDFGMRGCTCVEQAIIGGCAHLLSFDGTDAMPAAYHAQFNLNEGRRVGASIPATEHSVMTAWRNEQDAMMNMIENFGDGMFACVMDSYDYGAALTHVIPSIASAKAARGGFLVLRPDSGDPTDAVLQGLHAADSAFGSTINSKGFKVLKGCGVIQGDGIDIHTMEKIANATLEAGFSPENVAFGMGSGLVQKVNRDTMSFATKLCFIEYADGQERKIMKCPMTDPEKISFPGVLAVKRVDGIPTVFPAEHVAPEDDMLEVIYDCGPVTIDFETFDEVRDRVKREWAALPKLADPVSTELQELVQSTRMELQQTALSSREAS